MSRNDSQERTERATPKRLADARKKGEVARSRELTTAMVMLAAGTSLLLLGKGMISAVVDVLHAGLGFEPAVLRDPGHTVVALRRSIEISLAALAPFFAVVTVAAVCAPAMIGGWSFSLQAIAFKVEKLNPVSGLKRVFSINGLVELLKAMAKFALIGVVAVAFIWQSSSDLLLLGSQSWRVALGNAGRLMIVSLLVFCAPLLVIAAVDAAFQIAQHARKMRMTRQEVRDETKETDGNPEMKARIRAVQQEQANRRMMEQVPTADVLITNPTHFAVALRYDHRTMAAPQLVAKGADLIAARIRDVAAEHAIPVLSAPPLARALYRTTELNQEIPVRLYAVVARVLTRAYQLRRVRRYGGAVPPQPMTDFDDDTEI